jgi:lipid A disaccharide synthetase
MVGMYRASLLSRMGAPFLLRTKDRLLPNLIVHRRIVPEFVPCGHAAHTISIAVSRLLEDSQAMDQQRRDLSEVRELYAGHDPAAEAAAIILRGN